MTRLGEEYVSLRPAIDEAIQSVLLSGRYTLESELQAFEEEFAEYVGVRYAVGVGSGSDALRIALMLCDLNPGDEVITAPNTDNPTAAAIVQAGAEVVFADVDPSTFNLDPEQVAIALTDRTKVILPVHLFGHPANMTALCDLAAARGLLVVEDAALALGATHREQRVGSFGDFACFSVAPSKILGGFGDGGVIVTNDAQLAERARVWRNYGHGPGTDLNPANLTGGAEWRVVEHGFNSRLDGIQAAVLRVKLATLDDRLAARRGAAALYDELLADTDVVTPVIAPGNVSSYYAYTILAENRDVLRDALASRGVATRLYYNPPLYKQPAFSQQVGSSASFPMCEDVTQRALALPIFPQIKDDEVRFVATCVQEIVGKK
ncbi:MAG: DegT/DnrJ/EryC1/StrS family aminotransferase [Acidimicrobiia bacterium]|nr:DegT/DnrJ/EryC1/StrS family aminotransferase [Acidimicrobiia bacterium]